MGTQESSAVAVKRPALTPKALIHQKFGNKACYRIEEILQSADNDCLGLVIPQQTNCLYKCYLDLPELSVTSDTFPRKKDAEQSAAKIAIEKVLIRCLMHTSIPTIFSFLIFAAFWSLVSSCGIVEHHCTH